MDFQVVVLAGGTSEKLSPLVSQEVPKPMLPVANKPVLSYVLDLLEASNLKNIILVVETDEASACVCQWVSVAYLDRLNIFVATVPEDIGTAQAIRSLDSLLTATDILVMTGDIVSDVSPGSVAATHRKHGAVMTALFCPSPTSGPIDLVSSGGKDKARKPSRHNIVALDPTSQFLLHVASGAEVQKDIKPDKSILTAVRKMEIRSDLMDAHMYAFKRAVLMDVLDRKENFHSIKQDVLPYLVKTQLRSEISSMRENNSLEENSNGEEMMDTNGLILSIPNLKWLSQHKEISPSNFININSKNSKNTHKCCVYISGKNQYCARLNSIQAFSDINRDVIGEASHLSGYSFSSHNNIIHPSAILGSKTTVGPQCMLAEGSQLGDKCSVKRSVIGRHCRIGSNVKIVNSVVMNHVTIEDNCFVQGSVLSSNVHIQERASLKDCQVGAGYVITSGSEHKSESFKKKVN